MNTSGLHRAAARIAIATATAAVLATTAGAQTSRIMVGGRTFEVQSGRPIVIGPDGTPGYADADAPREVVAPRAEAADPRPAPRARVAVAEARDPRDDAYRAPDGAEDPGVAIAASSVAPVAAGYEAPAAAPVVAAPTPAPVAAVAAPSRDWARNLPVPTALADGSYPTPNRSISRPAAVWHLRTAINVAALGCRGTDGDRLVAGYNGMLGRHRAEFAAAELAVAKEYGANTKAGRARYDTEMTKLYNFWATPAAHDAFCHAAVAEMDEMEAAEKAGSAFDAHCQGGLAKLDAPFASFYRDYDAWRRTGYGDAAAPAAAPQAIAAAY